MGGGLPDGAEEAGVLQETLESLLAHQVPGLASLSCGVQAEGGGGGGGGEGEEEGGREQGEEEEEEEEGGGGVGRCHGCCEDGEEEGTGLRGVLVWLGL